MQRIDIYFYDLNRLNVFRCFFFFFFLQKALLYFQKILIKEELEVLQSVSGQLFCTIFENVYACS